MIRAWLLYPDREMDSQSAYAFQNDIAKDLNMEIIFKTMSRENENIKAAVKKVMLTPLHTEDEVVYRQEILQDVIKNSECFEQIYEMVQNNCHRMSAQSGGKSESKVSRMVQSLRLLETFVDDMIVIQGLLEEYKKNLTSTGVKNLMTRLSEVDWQDMKRRCKDMDFMSEGGSLTLNLYLGKGLKMEHITIQNCNGGERSKGLATVKNIKKVLHKVTGQNIVYLESEPLIKSVAAMKNAVMQHLLSHYDELLSDLSYFFKNMLVELGFYLGCGQLHRRFEELGIPLCMPTVVCGKEKTLYFQNLYELTLAIYTRQMPVPNDMAQVDKKLYVITGANQGGKSTFLRSIGIAQVMFQCGMFVPATAYSNRLYDTILTHFTRREDEQMNSGRLDEELNRMSRMLDKVTGQSMILLNESFASTTEKEGSMIAEDIVTALYELGTDTFMVTHLFEFARKQYEKGLSGAVYLTAQRKDNGERTFKMILHRPDHTSYGLDLYEEIIGKL